MIELNFEIEGEKQLARRFMVTPVELGNMKTLFFKIGREIRISVDDNFSSRGALFGSPWKPRVPQYRGGMRVDTWPLLEKTGRMRRAFAQNLGPDYVEIFNPTDYYKYHQSNKPRRKLPRRIMLKLDEIRKTFIVKEFQEHIRRALKDS